MVTGRQSLGSQSVCFSRSHHHVGHSQLPPRGTCAPRLGGGVETSSCVLGVYLVETQKTYCLICHMLRTLPHECASSFRLECSPVGASGPPWGRSYTQGGGSLACQCHSVMALSLGLSQNVSTGTSACLSRVAVLVVMRMFTVFEVEMTCR